MNAYELAEQLMTALATLENSAIMLRQLQKEKEQQADRIAELEKEKENYKYDPDTGEPLIDGYPLYSGLPTPQTKPLSDEEIWDWFKENTALTKESALKIAKAIEERHGIK